MNNLGNTLIGRVLANFNDEDRFLIGHRDDGGCMAYVGGWLGEPWRGKIHCSHRSRDGLFCGKHDHFYTLLGAEDIGEYVRRHGGRIELNDDGEIIAYYAPRYFRKKPKVEPYDA